MIILKNWNSFWTNNVILLISFQKYIVVYNSIQNDIIERDIKIMKNQIRIIIQNARLSMKFWFETNLTNAYIQNRVVTNSNVDENSINFIQNFTKIKSFIDYLRVWECICYSFVDTKLLFNNNKTNKFVNTKKFCVFINCDKNIITQYRMWIANSRNIIKHHKMIFSKHEKWKNESLNLFTITSNALFDKRFINKSRKTISIMFDVSIIVFNSTTIFAKNKMQIDVASNAIDEIDKKNATNSNDKSEINKFTIESTIQTRTKLTILTISSRITKQFLHVIIFKRKRKLTNEKKRNEHRNKIARVMFVFFIQNFDDKNNNEWILIVEVNNETNKQFVNKFVIFVSKIYENVINDFVWKKLWFEIIQIELTILIINETWKIVNSF